jgi:hypothetical protein
LKTELSRVIEKLNAAVGSGRARLESARRPAQQAAAGSELAAAYSQAAASLGNLNAAAPAADVVTALAGALAKTGRDYAALSSAASHDHGRAYDAARSAIGGDSGQVSGAFAELARLGYTAG